MQDDIIEEYMAPKKSKSRKTLYMYMLGFLFSLAAVFIVYNYQNETEAEF
jgi:hypothetical protein